MFNVLSSSLPALCIADLTKLLTSLLPLCLVDVRHDNLAPATENPPAELLPKPQSSPGDDEVPLHLSAAASCPYSV